jgi:choline-phosphate cytidylyltransferase
MDSLRTAFATAYERLLLMLKSGAIGDIKMIDVTCTSLRSFEHGTSDKWNSICEWGPNAMLPVFQLLGTDYVDKRMICKLSPDDPKFDLMTKVDFVYCNAVATIKVGKGIKAESELIISGTKGYAYVPSPWWKTDYFEIRYEDQSENKRFYYQLAGEGIRNELLAFKNHIMNRNNHRYIDHDVSYEFISVIQDFYDMKGVTVIE